MRRLGTLSDTLSAERFTASLRSRGIEAQVRREEDGSSAVWILDEDRLDEARGEFAAFQTNPQAERFQVAPAITPPSAPPAASPDIPRPLGPPSWKRVPVTLGLISISVFVTAVTLLGPNFGAAKEARRLRNELSIASYRTVGDMAYWDGLDDVRSGEVWRLVTPIFPHGSPLHLLFNIAWLWLLGGAVELLRGHLRLLLLVLVTAVASNLAEYFFDLGLTFDLENGLRTDTGFDPDPFFLGMSGVVFGLFGFVWMRARLLPGSGFAMPRDTVVWMLIWLLVCTSGFVGPIANVAHLVGLLVGMTLGAAPRLWRRA